MSSSRKKQVVQQNQDLKFNQLSQILFNDVNDAMFKQIPQSTSKINYKKLITQQYNNTISIRDEKQLCNKKQLEIESSPSTVKTVQTITKSECSSTKLRNKREVIIKQKIRKMQQKNTIKYL